jgi:hypothetical protein
VAAQGGQEAGDFVAGTQETTRGRCDRYVCTSNQDGRPMSCPRPVRASGWRSDGAGRWSRVDACERRAADLLARRGPMSSTGAAKSRADLGVFLLVTMALYAIHMIFSLLFLETSALPAGTTLLILSTPQIEVPRQRANAPGLGQYAHRRY